MSSLPSAFASLSLAGKVAFITGGSSGIGAATAKLLAARGAKVAIAARREEESKAVVGAIKEAGGDAFFVQMDVTVEEDIQKAIEQTVSHYGRIDIAFNNSGCMGDMKPTHAFPTSELDRVLNTNVKGVALCMKYELLQILKQIEHDKQPLVTSYDQKIQPNSYHKQATRYSLINNASIFGEHALPNWSAYSASKHAVIGLTKSAAVEYGPLGIRINTVNYGFIISGMSAGAMIDMMVKQVPAGRVGQGAEAAEAVAWLASDASSFVTGSSITVDGGVSAKCMAFA